MSPKAKAKIPSFVAKNKATYYQLVKSDDTSALVAMEGAMAEGRLADFLIGTDAPAGSGVQPNGMLRMATLLASFGELPAEQAWCCGLSLIHI